MPLTLYVDAVAWHEQLRDVVAGDPGLVPVVKGNGYGFTVPLLARTAAGLGVGTIAVGTEADAAVALGLFGGEVIVLQPPAQTGPLEGLGQRVLYTAASVEAAAALAGRRLVVECRSSLRRQGIAEADLAALWRVTRGGRAIEAFSLHLPIDRPPGTDPAAQVALWVRALTAAGYRVRTMYVSHLEASEMAALGAAFPGTTFRQRVGTRLWLGSRPALRAAATVLQVLPVRRGERLGYRQRRARRDGWLVMVAGGTAHGVGMQVPGAARGVRQRARALARSGLAAVNLVRSPFYLDGRKQWFAEPPHMLVSMLLLPRRTQPPEPGTELEAELGYLTTQFDRVTLSSGQCAVDGRAGAQAFPGWPAGRLTVLSGEGPAVHAPVMTECVAKRVS